MSAQIELPGPRIWTPRHLADFLGVSTSWVYKRIEAKEQNPIPRVKGLRLVRFDTQSQEFQSWLNTRLGIKWIDNNGSNN